MADDPVSAALARIRKTCADADRLELAGNFDGALLLSAVLAGEVPRLLAALDAALKAADDLAADAERLCSPAPPRIELSELARHDRKVMARERGRAAEVLRSSVMAELTGKEKTDA